MPRWPSLPRLTPWRGESHVPFVRLVALATAAEAGSSKERSDRRHVESCSTCASALDEIVHISRTARVTHASAAETAAAVSAGRSRLLRALASGEAPSPAPRLLDTHAGASVARALAPWLGDAGARAILVHARAGREAGGDVMSAVAHPLTAFLGSEAGRSLAVKLCRIAERDRHGAVGLEA